MIKWKISDEGNIIEDNGDLAPIEVCSVEEVSSTVIKQIIGWHNANMTIEKIESFLKVSTLIKEDEVMFIMDQIKSYEKFKEQEEALAEIKQKKIPLIEIESSKETIFTNLVRTDTPVYTNGTDPSLLKNSNQTSISPFITDIPSNSPNLVSENKGEIEKPKRTRQPKTEGEKRLTLEEFKAQMEERIKMVEFLEELTVPTMPETISRPSRKVLSEFEVEYDALIDKYLLIIQKM